MRLNERRIVLLPQPDGPMNAVTMFGWMPIVMFSSARFAP